tara:strand:+ start:897 stop:1235 length:339 start_codon:yes stop_codon:yes gene_type:complete
MMTNYGDIDLTREDISKKRSWSLDLRDLSGPCQLDESKLCEAGTFRLSVCGFGDGEIPIGEIRILFKGMEVSVVGHPTGRVGVVEITPEHLVAAVDSTYRATLMAWIEASAA